MPSTERWLTRTEAAELLRITPRTLDAYVRAGQLSRYYLAKLGPSSRSPRFRIEDVRALVETPEGRE